MIKLHLGCGCRNFGKDWIHVDDEDCLTAEGIKNKLHYFEELGIYNFMGNFGNILLKNKNRR